MIRENNVSFQELLGNFPPPGGLLPDTLGNHVPFFGDGVKAGGGGQHMSSVIPQVIQMAQF